MNNDQPAYIYELRDPDTRVTRYVGRTASTERRLENHLQLAKRNAHCNPKMNEWLGSLIRQGKSPLLLVAKTTTQEKQEVEEMSHIHKLLEQGCDLFNVITYSGYRHRHEKIIVSKQKAFYKAAGAFFYGSLNGADAIILNRIENRALIALYDLRKDKVICRTVKTTTLAERLKDSAIDQVLQQVSEEQAREKQWHLGFNYPTFKSREQ